MLSLTKFVYWVSLLVAVSAKKDSISTRSFTDLAWWTTALTAAVTTVSLVKCAKKKKPRPPVSETEHTTEQSVSLQDKSEPELLTTGEMTANSVAEKTTVSADRDSISAHSNLSKNKTRSSSTSNTTATLLTVDMDEEHRSIH